MSEFEGRIAWVTGASAGIGRALSIELARRGADVAVSARREDRLAEVASAIEAEGRRALVVPCDVTDEAQQTAAVDRIVRALGGLDVAVANAGYSVGGKIDKLSADEWRRQLDVNVVGAAMTAKHALPALREREGRLALVGSVAAMLPGPGSAAYAASKAAVLALGRSLAVELHGTGVSCTTIHPGFVDSDISRVDNENRYHEDWDDRRPAKLMWPTDKAARVMASAIEKRRREFVFTAHGKAGGWLGRHMPGLVHFAMTRSNGRARARGTR